ncbi:MAG: hypothetical protein PHT12_03640 [Patescibacteria group bacterium]|nr:hypothetical protein [Patescibacteria group bacterium]
MIRKTVNGDRHYEATGKIAFWYGTCPVEPNLETLAQAIREADAEHPWIDEPLPDEQWESIWHMSKGELVKHRITSNDEDKTERVVWFRIVTKNAYMRRAQVYAYERYLNALAQTLAKRHLPLVKEVSAVVEVIASTRFEV